MAAAILAVFAVCLAVVIPALSYAEPDVAEAPDQDDAVVEQDAVLTAQSGTITASSESELRDALAAGGEVDIDVTADIALSSGHLVIPNDSDVTISSSGGYTIKADDAAFYLAYMQGGSSLTLGSGLTLDGNGVQFVECTQGGSLTLDGATLKNGKSILTGSVIHIMGQGSAFAFTSGVIEDCTVETSGGVILIEESATGVMSGGVLRNCTVGGAGTYIDATVNVRASSSFTMTGGSIESNKSLGGSFSLSAHGLLVRESAFTMTGGKITGNGTSESVFGTNYPAGGVAATGSTLTISGGEISHNYGQYGGGILVYNSSLSLSGSANVSNNTAIYGGGIYVRPANGGGDASLSMSGGTVSGNYSWSFGGGVLVSTGASFDMTAGEISGNEGDSGGGIYISESENVTLTGGLIANNKASRHGAYSQGGAYGYGTGGGITVANTKSGVTMSDVLVTENTSGTIGGGAWLCPTGDVDSQISDGVAMFDNSAGHAADDLAVVSTTTTHNTDIIQGRILGGGVAERYLDGTVNTTGDVNDHGDGSGLRYRADGRRDRFDYSTWDGISPIALHNEASTNAKELAQQRAKLVITGNSSESAGGGIASNGHVRVGKAESKSVVVTKSWGLPEGAAAESQVRIMLEIDGAEDGVARSVEEITLDASNNWTHTFEGLPVKAKINLEEAAVTTSGWTTYYKESFSDQRTISNPDSDEPGTEQETYYALENVNVTNARIGSLEISKAIDGDLADANQEFQFEVTIVNPSDPLDEPIVDEQSGEALLYAPYEGRNAEHHAVPLDFSYSGSKSGTLVAGTGTITLKAGEKVTVEGLPHGAQYRVRELAGAADGYEIEPVRDDGAKGHAAELGTIVGDETTTLAYTNVKDSNMGSLKVSKAVTGDAADSSKLFHFQVRFYHADGSELTEGEFAYVNSHEGVIGSGGMFALKGGESIHIDGIPTGTKWTVKEVPADAHGYEIEPVSGSLHDADAEEGAIVSGKTSELAYTNEKNLTMGALAITKEVSAGDASRDFEFAVTFTDASGADIDYGEFAYTGAREGIVESGDTLKLKHGERVVIEGLPEGTNYKVREVNADNYKAAYEGAEGAIAAAATSEAKVVNTVIDAGKESAAAAKTTGAPRTGDVVSVAAGMLALVCALTALAAALARARR